MIQKVEMYTIVCDNCKKDIGIEQDYSCWNDELYAESNASDSGWIKIDDKHYCDECCSCDDDDNYSIDETKKDKYAIH